MNKQYYLLDIDGSLTAKKSGWKESDPQFQEELGIPILLITVASYFDEERCQSDWTDGEVFEELDSAGFETDSRCDGVIAFERGDGNALKTWLEGHPGFEKNADFDYLMDS